MSITILKPGIMSSIQDLGRWGYQQFGVPVSGAMDRISASVANIICGNDENEAVIEMTLHGTSILFNENTYCAITGGGCQVYIDEIELPFNRLLYIPAFTILHTKSSSTGCRSYLAMAGGLEIEKQMGSASTYTASGIGGMKGRNLKTGDILSIKKTNRLFDFNTLKTISGELRMSHWHVPDLVGMNERDNIIHVVAGPEYDLFDEVTRNKFFQSTYTIGLQSNRMGYRLEGEKLFMIHKHEMVSTPVTEGIIQVTNEGHPIILMADAQTTGGYPRIARVCTRDISKLSQMQPGEKIKFNKIDEKESLGLDYKMNRKINKLKTGIK